MSTAVLRPTQRVPYFAKLAAPALAGLLLALPLVSQAGQLYRYNNEQGGIEISASVPNELVINGYQVIDSATGRVLRTVAPQLTAEQARLKAAREARLAQCSDTQRRVNSLYETLEDIDHAENQALDSIETRIINAQAGLTQLRNQERDLEDQAARLERSGHGVTASLVGDIDLAKTQIENLEVEILGRRVEQDEARKQFDRDREVFQQGDCAKIAAKVTILSLQQEAKQAADLAKKRHTCRQWLDLPVAE